MRALEYVMKRFNKNIAGVSTELGINRSSLSLYLNGGRKLPKKFFGILPDAFGGIGMDVLNKNLSELSPLELLQIDLAYLEECEPENQEQILPIKSRIDVYKRLKQLEGLLAGSMGETYTEKAENMLFNKFVIDNVIKLLSHQDKYNEELSNLKELLISIED